MLLSYVMSKRGLRAWCGEFLCRVQVLSVSVLSLWRRAALAAVTRARRRRSSTSSTTRWRRRGRAAACTTCYRALPASCRPLSVCFIPSRGSAVCTRCSTSASSPFCDTSVSISSTACRYHHASKSTSSTAAPPPPTPRDPQQQPGSTSQQRNGRGSTPTRSRIPLVPKRWNLINLAWRMRLRRPRSRVRWTGAFCCVEIRSASLHLAWECGIPTFHGSSWTKIGNIALEWEGRWIKNRFPHTWDFCAFLNDNGRTTLQASTRQLHTEIPVYTHLQTGERQLRECSLLGCCGDMNQQRWRWMLDYGEGHRNSWTLVERL